MNRLIFATVAALVFSGVQSTTGDRVLLPRLGAQSFRWATAICSGTAPIVRSKSAGQMCWAEIVAGATPIQHWLFRMCRRSVGYTASTGSTGNR